MVKSSLSESKAFYAGYEFEPPLETREYFGYEEES
jgi:hypothetical protein